MDSQSYASFPFCAALADTEMIKLDIKSKVISAEELEDIINNAPIDNVNSEEFNDLVFKKTTMQKIVVYWIVIIVFSQVSVFDEANRSLPAIATGIAFDWISVAFLKS